MHETGIFQQDIHAFFDFIQTIRYGYMDSHGVLHFIDDEDFEVRDYAFSGPEDVIRNRCGWCWDVANLIVHYCRYHKIQHKCLFLEYFSPVLHQTHTQVFLRHNGTWYAAPDNSSPDRFGDWGFDSDAECIHAFTAEFVRYLKHVLKENYDQRCLLCKEIHGDFPSGISDEEYLTMARS